MASDTQLYNKARKADPNLRFATWKKGQETQSKIDATQKTKRDRSTSGRQDLDRIEKATADTGNKRPTGSAKQGDTRVQGSRNQTYTGSYWRTESTFKKLGDRTEEERKDYTQGNLDRGQKEYEKATGKKLAEGQVYDPYAALQGQNMEGGTGSVSPYIAEGKASAIRDRHAEGVGDIPTDPATQEGYGDMTKEQQQQAQIDYKTSLAEWYRKVGEVGQAELGDISGQVQDFGNQMQQYEEAIDSLMANISQSNPELGTALGEVFAELQESGNGNLTPEALASIQDLASQGLPSGEFKAQVSALLSGIPASNLQATGITDDGDSYTTSSGISFPKGANGLPDFDPANLDPNTTAGDLMLMELAMGREIADGTAEQEIQLWLDYAKSADRARLIAKQEADLIFDTSSNKVNEQMLATMNEQKYQKMKLEIEKNNSLGNILEQGAQMEGYMKGQLEAWGATESSAALSVMGNIKNKFLKQYTQTAQGYDLELSRVSDKITEAQMAYTNRNIEIANQKALSYEKINNSKLDDIDKVFSGTKATYQNRDMKFLELNVKYFKDLRGLKVAEEEAIAEAEKDTRDFNFKMMKEMADNKDLVYEVGEDGSIKLKLGADGRPISNSGSGSYGSGSGSYSSGSYSPNGYTENSGDSGGFRAYLEANAPETLSPPVKSEFVTNEMGWLEKAQGIKDFNEAVMKYEQNGHWASPDFNNPEEVDIFNQYSNVDNSAGRFGDSLIGIATGAILSGKGVGVPKLLPQGQKKVETQKTEYTGNWETDNAIRQTLANEKVRDGTVAERDIKSKAERFIYENNLTPSLTKEEKLASAIASSGYLNIKNKVASGDMDEDEANEEIIKSVDSVMNTLGNNDSGLRAIVEDNIRSKLNINFD